MTALAIVKSEVASESSFAGVTARAGLRASVNEVLGRSGWTYLACLRRTGSQLVAIRARETLPRAVVLMTESETIGTRVRARRTVRFLLVTNSARRNLATGVGFTRRRVTGVAIVMCGEVCGNRQPCTTVDGRAVTTHATILRSRRACVVLCVIELHVERFVEIRGKIL